MHGSVQGQPAGNRRHFGFVLDRIPEQVGADRPFPMRRRKPLRQPGEFAWLLERWIDQHHAAPGDRARGFGLGVALDETPHAIPIGTSEVERVGADVNLFAYGSMVPVATEAAATLAMRGVDCGVINARFAKPLDMNVIQHALQNAPRFMTLEEHLVSGGLGSAVLEALEQRQIDATGVRVHAIPDQFIDHGPQAYQRAKFHLDAAGVVEAVLAAYPDLAHAKEQAAPRAPAQPEAVRW